MALAGWVYQSRENALKFSFSNAGNVAEKTVQVKAGKILLVAGCCAGCWLLVAGRWLLVAGCWLIVADGKLRLGRF
jgi:hypothetical protein